MKKSLLIRLLNLSIGFCLLIIPGLSFGQKNITTYQKDSTFILTRDSRIDDLIAKQKDSNTLRQTIPGYRVQIYFGSVRQKASEVKLDINSKHAEMSSYLTYLAPNFKVRVGDFRTRLEAQGFLKSIEGQYPTSFIVQDEIRLPSMYK
ncbi:MAG: SPOR domain-containing protein [Bacteroidota bacterium]